MDLQNETFENLVDLLSEHTERYSRFLVGGNRGEEFQSSKRIIKLIQAEIGARQQRPRTTDRMIPMDIVVTSPTDAHLQGLAGL